MRRSRETFLFYVGAGAALLPILLLRDFTPANELRYLSMADEALRNGTFFAFTNHGVPYADKPPLYFWLLMACRWLTGGHTMALAALFSLLPAWGVVRTMNRWTIPELDSERRLLARLMLMTSGLFVGAAVTLRMDMLMTFFIVSALHAFWQMLKKEGAHRSARWKFPVFLFLAVFTKGPMGLLIPLASTAVFLKVTKRGGTFFRYWNGRTWGVLLGCCALWFGAVWLEGGSGYLRDLLFRQTLGRAVNSFHHAAPFYYYGVSIWYSLAPWSLLAVGAVAASLRPKFVRSDLQCFFLCVGTTTFVLLSAVSSKLGIYLLPAIPFLVYATVMFLSRFPDGVWIRVSLTVPAVTFVFVLPALFAVTSVSAAFPFLNEGPCYVAATILSLNGAHVLYMLYRSGRGPATYGDVVRRMGAGLLLAMFAMGWAIPGLNAYIGYGDLCRKAEEMAQTRGIADVRAWHLTRAENMDVYLHRRVEPVAGDEPPVAGGTQPFLLLTKKRYMDQVDAVEAEMVGSYAVVVCR